MWKELIHNEDIWEAIENDEPVVVVKFPNSDWSCKQSVIFAQHLKVGTINEALIEKELGKVKFFIAKESEEHVCM